MGVGHDVVRKGGAGRRGGRAVGCGAACGHAASGAACAGGGRSTRTGDSSAGSRQQPRDGGAGGGSISSASTARQAQRQHTQMQMHRPAVCSAAGSREQRRVLAAHGAAPAAQAHAQRAVCTRLAALPRAGLLQLQLSSAELHAVMTPGPAPSCSSCTAAAAPAHRDAAADRRRRGRQRSAATRRGIRACALTRAQRAAAAARRIGRVSRASSHRARALPPRDRITRTRRPYVRHLSSRRRCADGGTACAACLLLLHGRMGRHPMCPR